MSSQHSVTMTKRFQMLAVGLCCFATLIYISIFCMHNSKKTFELVQEQFNTLFSKSVDVEEFRFKLTQQNNPNFIYRKLGERNGNITKTGIKLLTLFTTWPVNDTKQQARLCTLRNWEKLKPFIRPVFFSSNRTNTSFLKKSGWSILNITKTANSGVPILKHMFTKVISAYKSLFYGYANGDILFDEGLIQTLLKVANHSWTPEEPILVIGRRTNVKNITEPESRNVSNLMKVAKKRGRLFITIAEDYFITDSSFPWTDIPEVVIGRRGYDNWLVLHSCKHRYNVIDATNTLLALHQTTSGGDFEGHKGDTYNIKLLSKIYKSIKYGAGSTSCAPFYTRVVGRTGNDVTISRRNKLPDFCFQY